MKIEKLNGDEMIIEVYHNEQVYLDVADLDVPIHIHKLGEPRRLSETFNDGVNQLRPLLVHGRHHLKGTKQWNKVHYKIIICHTIIITGNLGG